MQRADSICRAAFHRDAGRIRRRHSPSKPSAACRPNRVRQNSVRQNWPLRCPYPLLSALNPEVPFADSTVLATTSLPIHHPPTIAKNDPTPTTNSLGKQANELLTNRNYNPPDTLPG